MMGLSAKSGLIAVGVIAALLHMPSRSASAATLVGGQLEGLQIDAQNASIREILDALSAKFNLTYKLSLSVSRNLTGLYSGSLHQALARILDGNDYILEVSEGSVTVVVLGASATTPVLPGTQALAAGESAIAFPP